MEATLHLTCASCGAALNLSPEARTAVCPYCAAPQVVERPPEPGRPDPAFTVAFIVPREKATELAQAFVKKSRLFTPSAFKRARVEDIRGLYVPAWLYSATARSRYEAEIGEHYQVTETYTTTDAKGNTQTHTRTRTETEWRHLEGTHASYVHDVLVTASKGLANDDLERIEPFDLRALRRYRAELIAGFIAEDPSMPESASRQMAREEAEKALKPELAAFLPGDVSRGLRFQTDLSHEDTDLVLLPVWVLPVRWNEKKPPVRLLVNGQTGEAVGRPPISPLRVTLAVLLGLGAIGGIVALVLELLK